MKKVILLLLLICSTAAFSLGQIDPIAGYFVTCETAEIDVSDATPGGTWTTSSTGTPYHISYFSSPGHIHCEKPGKDTIYYIVGGDSVSTVLTINPVPKIFNFDDPSWTICFGDSLHLWADSLGGTWATTISSISDVDPLGEVDDTERCNAFALDTLKPCIDMVFKVTYTRPPYYQCPNNSARSSSIFVLTPGCIIGDDELCEGSTLDLSAVPEYGTWSSSDPSVASIAVLDGKAQNVRVTGVSPGTATISYTASGASCYATKVVTVYPVPAITGTLELHCSGTTTLSSSPSGGTWSSSNTSVATIGDSTGVVSGVAPGTSTITYALSTGCYITTVVTVTVPSISGPSGVIVGSTITLTGTPSGGTWSSSNPSAATVNSSGVVSGVSAGSTEITYTLSEGCYAVKVITVCDPLGISICEVAPFHTCDAVVSYCSGLSLKVYGGDEGAGYSWSPSLPATVSYEGTDAVFTCTTAPSNGVYTVTVTNSSGCSGTATVRIVTAISGCYPCDNFKPCGTTCAGCDTVVPFKTIISTTLDGSQVSTTSAGNYFITSSNPAAVTTSTLTVSPAPGSVFYVGKYVQINVKKADSIVLNNCHFFAGTACTWRGILLEGSTTQSGKLSVENNTLIENAYNSGVTVSAGNGSLPAYGGYLFNSDNAIYNQDVTGVYMVSHKTTATMPYRVVGSVFTNRDFCDYHSPSGITPENCYPFSWPTASHLQEMVTGGVANDPTYTLDSFPASIYTNSQGSHGVYLNQFGMPGDTVTYGSTTVIGDSMLASNTNMFDTLLKGVRIVGSNVSMYNNIFRRCANGVDISYNDGFCTWLKQHADSGGTNNRFYNCHNCVYSLSCSNFLSQGTEMRSTNYMTSSRNLYGFYLLNPARLQHHELTRNRLYNIYNGVYEATGACDGSSVLVNDNYFKALSSSLGTEHTAAAISVVDGTSCEHVADFEIRRDTIEGYTYGICITPNLAYPTRVTNLRAVIDSNYIIVRDNGINATRYGIECVRVNDLIVTSNRVFGDTGSGVTYALPAPVFSSVNRLNGYRGISLVRVGSPSVPVQVSCNYVHDIPIGFNLLDTCTMTWEKNVMMRNKYGMVLQSFRAGSVNYPARIGTQGSACSPSDNVWYDDGTDGTTGWPGWTGAGIYQTFGVGADPSNSTLYVRGNHSTSYPYYYYNPTNNGDTSYYSFTHYPYTSGTSLIDCETECESELDAAVTCAPIDVSESRPGSGAGFSNTIESGGYSLFPNPTSGALTIRQQVAADMQARVKLVNYAGQLVQEVNGAFSGGKLDFRVSDAVPGVYMVVLICENGNSSTFRVVFK